MNPRVGVVSYGARGAAIADILARSKHNPELYVVSKQRNPMNVCLAERSGGRHVVGDLSDVTGLAQFFRQYRPDFVFVGPEDPIINGFRGAAERYGISVISPTAGGALEGSKARQRRIFQSVYPNANPKFKVFEQGNYEKREVEEWLKELNYRVAIKPSSPEAGKGVVVAEDHFQPTRDEALAAFSLNMENMEDGERLVVEELVEGEESSFQAFGDGNVLLPVPDTRDYKRAEEGGKGPNTGGMGSYCDTNDWLPFMNEGDWKEERKITQRLFNYMREQGYDLKGVPLYMAFTHTGEGPKVLEVNSRPGDPEILNIVPLIENDFLETCFDMRDGNLGPDSLRLRNRATVVIYKVPHHYGREGEDEPGEVNLREAKKLVEGDRGKLRVYPADMILADGKTYSRTSRTVACVGIGGDIEEAGYYALELIDSITGGNLRFRSDVASPGHIQKSIDHMKKLRGGN